MAAIASSSRSTASGIMLRSTAASCSTSPASLIRAFSSSSPLAYDTKYVNPWKKKAHLRPPPSIPPPLPALFRQTVSLSDGSVIYTNTTAPSPQIIRLTRDVTNNPVWSPGIRARGAEEDQEGAVGRFKRRFEGMDLGSSESPATSKGGEGGSAQAQSDDDLSWMSEGGREEKAPKIPEKKVTTTKGKKK
ncbi:hypothetical protein BD324DRAFT_612656 [Kockovaella imperatae]|uniref:Uncharacterized protein n=1 Tax=Kockovaella imperatae TaxID=4999 RepID=A0A1Y1USE8_9TREE|nr:hypothetical protein BD324DRAFT_612656 [Kockovaella imperatae]ORX40950.1 hypothetical protein BD324DRAFT_612656 [Kockovaella imperatae]